MKSLQQHITESFNVNEASNAVFNAKIGRTYQEGDEFTSGYCIASEGRDNKWSIATVGPVEHYPEKIKLIYLKKRKGRSQESHIYKDALQNNRFYKFFDSKEEAEKALKMTNTMIRGEESDRKLTGNRTI